MAFEYPWHGRGWRACACGRVTRTRPIDGFVPQQQRPIYLLPTNIEGRPCRHGVAPEPKAVELWRKEYPLMKVDWLEDGNEREVFGRLRMQEQAIETWLILL